MRCVVVGKSNTNVVANRRSQLKYTVRNTLNISYGFGLSLS